MPNDPAGPDEDAGHLHEPEPQAPAPSFWQRISQPERPADDRFERADGAGVDAPLPPEAAPAVDAPSAAAAASYGMAHDQGRFDGDWERVEPGERYLDVPGALELAYGPADVGLSEGAYERAYPYEAIEKRRRRESGTRYRRVGRELVETIILALLIFFAVKALVQNFRVEGQSMEPSMHNNEYLLVNKALYFKVDLSRLHDFLPFVPSDNGQERHLFRPPRRGDVVVFKFPLDPARDFIKRVIGVPGDTVEVKDEKVFINGSPLTENYILATPNYTYGPKTVPPGAYFVLGDNRRNSYDSHAWGGSCSAQTQCDFVPEANIIGQAWVSYWPFDQLGFINNKKIAPSAP